MERHLNKCKQLNKFPLWGLWVQPERLGEELLNLGGAGSSAAPPLHQKESDVVSASD